MSKSYTSESLLADYRLIVESRLASYAARKDVFSGKAKFGITGDGKEIAQLALSKFFKKGDWRSGYYRDQTLLVAQGLLTWQQYFAQLYAHANQVEEPHSAGRSMNAHYGNAWFDAAGNYLNQLDMVNSFMDVSSTAGQIPRALGLAYASKLYRHNHELQAEGFSDQGNEICWTTIGDASTSQGMFFEAFNAAGVLQVPLVFLVWDDGYGISVPKKYQTTKESISAALAGFQRTESQEGVEIIEVKGWDFEALMAAYEKANDLARNHHIPVLIHVVELTQPQGHSTSGSHERYKNHERLQYEHDFDCNVRFRSWLLAKGFATEEQLSTIEKQADETIKTAKALAWNSLRSEIDKEVNIGLRLVKKVMFETKHTDDLQALVKNFAAINTPIRKDLGEFLHASKRILRFDAPELSADINAYLSKLNVDNTEKYHSWLYSESPHSPLKTETISPIYSENAKVLDGREIINQTFNHMFATQPEVVVLGEDVGYIGDVNQGLAGIQEKYGELRITDTGIREATILGQGIGLAARGFRPIIEVQYLDYIYYALSLLTDDVACLSYRTKGHQRIPLIVRTRGHRLEGIWHSGSPMAVLIHSLRGMHLCVPRDFVQATAMYQTLLEGDDPALIIEPLNGYRVKETCPENLSELRLKLGEVEVLRMGKDLTIVTYGSMVRIVMAAATELAKLGIEAEVIDVQTLLPFDRTGSIVKSLQKTNRIVFADEDMPGGATAFMLQEVIEKQGGYKYLDSAPVTITAKAHRPAYGTDGDYFSKPSEDTVIEAAYALMHEANPAFFPKI